MSVDKLIVEARALCAKATPGPWEATLSKGDCGNPKGCVRNLMYCDDECPECEHWEIYEGAHVPTILTVDCGEFDYMDDATAEFITQSRTLIPALCDALEAVPRWIPETGLLPEDAIDVLVYRQHDDGGACIDMAYRAGGKWHGAYDGWRLCDVTHWRPLPEPPEEAPNDQT